MPFINRVTPARASSREPLNSNRAQIDLRERGVTATGLAKVAGVSVKSASRWLRGEKTPDEGHARTIERELGIPERHWRVLSDAAAEGVTEVLREVSRVSGVRAVVFERRLPPDWARKPGESRPELFARRIAWHHAELDADRIGGAAPALTSDVDSAEVARIADRIRTGAQTNAAR